MQTHQGRRKGLVRWRWVGPHASKGLVILLPPPAGELALLKAGGHLVEQRLSDLPLVPPPACMAESVMGPSIEWIADLPALTRRTGPNPSGWGSCLLRNVCCVSLSEMLHVLLVMCRVQPGLGFCRPCRARSIDSHRSFKKFFAGQACVVIRVDHRRFCELCSHQS